jgi:hypothetical protein
MFHARVRVEEFLCNSLTSLNDGQTTFRLPLEAPDVSPDISPVKSSFDVVPALPINLIVINSQSSSLYISIGYVNQKKQEYHHVPRRTSRCSHYRTRDVKIAGRCRCHTSKDARVATCNSVKTSLRPQQQPANPAPPPPIAMATTRQAANWPYAIARTQRRRPPKSTSKRHHTPKKQP